MKTLLIIASIFVVSHGKQIKLNQSDITYLKSHSTNFVKCTLANFKNGGIIRNNESADQIFVILGK